ncbi:MAG: hypothetical protein Tp178MES00d2C33159851_173 [Prokaryotic dsDNA virus sp.]|nr:MAG: hypothetical protein Tp178MES00d2C33159851_173 [Prokaryotic dsDNA virus sp.]|tara:strand:- start:421 stop:612 length:192 start_codon:yes stop_codon:yes gene_type:complete
MLRFILRTEVKDPYNGARTTEFRTIDFYAPELASALSAGGRTEDGYEFTELVGVEILNYLAGD